MAGDSRDFFVPRRGLRSGHLQTLAGRFLPREDHLPAPEPRLFSVEADVQVRCECHWQPDRESRLTLIIVHGLEGSSQSQYVIGTSNKAWAEGMNVVRMNVRNCGGTEALSPTLYHSGMSYDVGAVARTLIEEDHLQRVAFAGYSMGGNLVLKLDGEYGDAPPPQVKAFAAISPACDLALSADVLHEWQNRAYEIHFMQGLRRRMRLKQSLFPDRYKNLDLRGIWSVREFDDKITAPHSGFRDGADYYHRASAARVIDRISVPTMVIHSKDDPFIRMTPETAAQLHANPRISFFETEHGGHCAFVADPNGYDGRWAERKIIEWLLQIS